MIEMKEVTYKDYLKFVEKHKEITLEGQLIPLSPMEVLRLTTIPKEITDITTTVWSFPERGSWATHRGDYRGNWAPQIPRALILMYTEPGDVVLDQMVGGGTTLIEARVLGRNSIGVDINYNAVMLTLHRLYYLEEYANKILETASPTGSLARFVGLDVDPEIEAARNIAETWSKVYHGDARNLDKIADNSVDLIATHPPYFNIIKYSEKDSIEGDLSRAKNLEEYLSGVELIAKESYRVLKPGKYCAVLIGDTRIHKHYVPITHHVLHIFLKTGFILKEEIIKIQHKMKTTRELWNKRKNRDFLLIYHEKLFIFRKPITDNEKTKYKYSTLPQAQKP